MPKPPKPKKPPPPPRAPTMADPGVIAAGEDDRSAYSSMISTSPIGILSPATRAPRTLIGGV